MAKISAKKLCLSGLFTAIIVICSWITIPSAVPFTLQIFAIVLSCYVLGFYAFLSYFCYLLLGIIGVPVFSGFNFGISVIIGPTGGFLLGFIFTILISVIGRKLAQNQIVLFFITIIGLVACYIFGTIWYVFIYLKEDFTFIINAIKISILPFVLFDIVKIILAQFISQKIIKIGV